MATEQPFFDYRSRVLAQKALCSLAPGLRSGVRGSSRGFLQFSFFPRFLGDPKEAFEIELLTHRHWWEIERIVLKNLESFERNRFRSVLPWLILSWVLVAIPVGVIDRYPPIVDLPQLLEQIKLLSEVLAGRRPDLEVQVWSPNKLGYAVLIPAWWLGGPAFGPRLAAWGLAAVVLAGCAWAVHRLGLPGERLLWCVPWIWSCPYQVGLAHFVLGFVPALFWIEELRRAPRAEERAVLLGLKALGLGLFLYLAHALWLLWAGFLWLGFAVAFRRSWKTHLARGIGLGIPFLVAAAWYLTLEQRGWREQGYWYFSLEKRWFSLDAIAAHFLGVSRGSFEPALLAVLFGFCLWGWLTGSKNFSGNSQAKEASVFPSHRVYLGIALPLLLFALLGPEAVGDTALFSRRWGAIGGLFLMLSAPEPHAPNWLKRSLVCLVPLITTIQVAVRWEQADSQGFKPLLSLAPLLNPGDRLLEVERYGPPQDFWLPVLRHAALYLAAERGIETNFSFAEFPSSLVVYRKMPLQRGWRYRTVPGPPGLTAQDLSQFDWILFSGRSQDQIAFGRMMGLKPVASAGVWVLWRGHRIRGSGERDQFPGP